MAGDLTAQRVRALIDASGLSQAGFAAKAGLDASKMSKSLSGVRRFSSLDLAHIAELGGVSVDWLLGAKPAKPALAARASNTHDGAVEAAVREATRFAQAREDLAFLGYHQPEGPTITAGRKVDGEELAASAVEEVRTAGGDPLARDLSDVIETCFGVDLAVTAIPAGCDGLAWRDDHARLILVATTEYPTRQRFTIVHELGHLLAGDDQGLHVDEDVMDPERRRQPSERRANAFAAAFLLPEHELRAAVPDGSRLSLDTFAALVMRFSVSPSTLAYRLGNLRLITAGQRKEFRKLTTAACALRTGKAGEFAAWIEASRQPRLPGVLVRDSFSAYVDGKATLRPFANLVGMDVEMLRRALETPAGPGAAGDEPEFAP
ncbi:helix-turn-helix domain-containing protein [Actinopolymorpha alba]|uniref:helix-turn-helix domain-containing protein n=1 Tax=Actinopolymorpha alba TaxID=533267 RepID=UPI00035D12EA|nr:XRE family transcriptional regulator [Actinopolymorpha alba]